MNTIRKSPPEQDLVRRAQRGEIESFEVLYRRTVGRTYAVCLRMCNDATQAEDLCQEAYVRAWQNLRTFKGSSSFATWLHRLTVNVVLSSYRKSSQAVGKALDFEDFDHVDDAQPPIASVTGIDLENAIAHLPTRARTVFVLHDVEGYKHGEIAKMTGMAVGTSKAHLNRARQLLREALKS